jgi:hypothetical protein
MEKFKVHVKFDHGGGGIIEDHTEDTLMSALQRLVLGPAAMMGIVQEVRCVDSGDCTNFLARKVDGKVKVLYPPHLVR